jgi:hypothetical protein
MIKAYIYNRYSLDDIHDPEHEVKDLFIPDYQIVVCHFDKPYPDIIKSNTARKCINFNGEIIPQEFVEYQISIEQADMIKNLLELQTQFLEFKNKLLFQ